MVAFTGLSSVWDRTVFTDKGPIVKKPLDILSGTNLKIISETEVEIPTGSFTSTYIGYYLVISGSLNTRNDGTFIIDETISTTRLRLSNANFDVTDYAATTIKVVAMANTLKVNYNRHRIQSGIHGTNDTTNVVSAATADSLSTAIILLNDIKAKLNAHVIMISGIPQVHKFEDDPDIIVSNDATQLMSAVILANEIRSKYENHRKNRYFHVDDDIINRVLLPRISIVKYTYPNSLTGPFTWVLQNPQFGMVANDPIDVQVYVNSIPAAVDAVFGMLGAVVLSTKPNSGDVVTIDYSWISNPPARMLRLNSPEFNLNQEGNTNYSGYPQHRYRSRAHLINPGNTPDLASAFQPKVVGWKYKGYERAYTAALNDPTTLLLNVPINKIKFPVLSEKISEDVIRYTPTTLPQDAVDPWILEGDGTTIITSDKTELVITDSNIQTGTESMPPFFTHNIDIKTSSVISAAFRSKIEDYEADGVNTGVSLGISDGNKVIIVGFIISDAINLSSAMYMANDIRAKFEVHLTNVGSHEPNDVGSYIPVVNATNLSSLVTLLNNLKSTYNSHIAKGSGSGSVHQLADAINVVISPDASNLNTSIILVNEIKTKFNAHREQLSVHFLSDTTNVVEQVKQVGILTNRNFAEYGDAWETYAADWAEYVSYRAYRDSDGNAFLYLSASATPVIQVDFDYLPQIADIDGKFDPIQQIFFGPIGRDSKSVSRWQFVYADITPLDANLIEDNKSVDYEASIVPELDPDAPWMTVGQGGHERILPGNILLLDSTAKAAEDDISALGLSSGAYRGYVRLEPILSVDTASSVEFQTSIDYYTFGIDNKSAGLFTDDKDFSIQFAFLQYSPSAATTLGTARELFPMAAGDLLVIKIDNGPEISISFAVTDTIATNVVSKINSHPSIGFAFASNEGGKIRLTSATLGATASFEIIKGSSLAKLGFSPGIYFGLDSNPEPKVSWFGANLPNLDDPTWTAYGSQSPTMLGRTLRITDSSITDYLIYDLSDTLVTTPAFGFDVDWKLDARLAVKSFILGDFVPAPGPFLALKFAGALVSINEGISGRNIELHLSVDPITNDQYLNLVSYNSTTGILDVVAQYAFAWNDGQIHTYNIYTSKTIDNIYVYADGLVLTALGPAPLYSGLNPGTGTTSVSFGSGGDLLVGTDMRLARSVVDWESVAVFKDSKVNDLTSASRRYIGIYKGGNISLLSSYYLHQVDWSMSHVYRIVRDPIHALSVYVDNGAVPVISIPYDVLRLPSFSSSFISPIAHGQPTISFGSFNPEEISRTRWTYIKYSIGKITLNERMIIPHQVTNQANVIASPEHLKTQAIHYHFGFKVYSGGTPIDDFMADETVPAYTQLYEGTVPVPMTQNLESRGGLIKTGTPLDTIPSLDLVNTQGFIADLEDDTYNTLSSVSVTDTATALSDLMSLTNDIKSKYNTHFNNLAHHFALDTLNAIVSADATDLSSSVTLVNEIKLRFNNHIVEPGLLPPPQVHTPDDAINTVTTADAIDLPTAIDLANEIRNKYEVHRLTGSYHSINDTTNSLTIIMDPILPPSPVPVATDLTTAAILADLIKDRLNQHINNVSSTFHTSIDVWNITKNETISGIGTAEVDSTFTFVYDSSFKVSAGETIEFLSGPNSTAGTRLVTSFISNSEFTVPALVSEDPRILFPNPPWPLSRFAKVVGGNHVIGSSSVIGMANILKVRFNDHIGSNAHPILDSTNIVTTPDAFDLASAIALINQIRLNYESHLIGSTVHVSTDTINVVAPPLVDNPLSMSILVLNDFRYNYLLHVIQQRVHLANDVDHVILTPDATDLTTAIDLANSSKEMFNLHIPGIINETQKIHSIDDVINVITSSDATDLASLAILSAEIGVKYEAHRVQDGVHGSSLFIRIDPPSRVLYENLAFWQFPTGDTGRLFPISDDETYWLVSGINSNKSTRFSYDGSILPEDATVLDIVLLANNIKFNYNNHRTELGIHPANDLVNVISAPDAIDLTSAITLLNDIKSMYNSHLIELGVHIVNDTQNGILNTDASEIYTALALVNAIKMQYEFHRLNISYHSSSDIVNMITVNDAPPVTSNGWQLITEGSGTPSVSLVTVGPVDALRYGTGVIGINTVYKNATPIPDTRCNFEFSVNMKINSYPVGPNVDTSIYSGFLSSLGPGIAAAVGFEMINNIPFVKIQDVNSNQTLYRTNFDWTDGNFHQYKLVYNADTNAIGLVID